MRAVSGTLRCRSCRAGPARPVPPDSVAATRRSAGRHAGASGRMGPVVRSTTRVVRRVLVTAVGAVVLGTGVVLLAAPGPGFLVIALGLLILGTEYEWARRHAEAARRKAADLADKAAANRVSASFTVLFALCAMGAGIVWGLVETLPGSS